MFSHLLEPGLEWRMGGVHFEEAQRMFILKVEEDETHNPLPEPLNHEPA